MKHCNLILGLKEFEAATVAQPSTVSDIAAAKATFCNKYYPELFDHCMINGIFCETTFNENALILDHFLSEDESDESNGPGIEE